MAVEPLIKSGAKPEMGEIATIRRDVTRFVFGGILENLDDTLRTRGRGKGLKIYDELERDCEAYADLQKRKLAVIARPWQVDPASDATADQEAAEIVRRQLQGLGFDQLTLDLLDATLKGYAVAEVMWEARDSELVARRVIPRDQRRFVFDEESRLRMLTREKLWDGIELPPLKFLVHRFGAKDGSPYGLGLGHKLFWPVYFKKQDISFWLVFADKFGSPTGLGKYPSGASTAEQTKLLDALKAIAQDAGIIIPQGMEVELLEAARTGSIDTYEKLARYMDEQIQRCVLGETITGSSKSTGLGSGVAEAGTEVRTEIAKADADLLSDTLNETLVRWIVDLNRPGAGYPTVYRVFEQPEDLDRRSQVDERLHAMGYEPETIEQINETYGGRWRKKAAPSAPALLPGAEFAEPADRAAEGTEDQRTLEQAAEELAGGWEELLGSRVDELVAMAESTGDLATFRERLAELLKAPPSEALVESLTRAGFTAQLLGRTEER